MNTTLLCIVCTVCTTVLLYKWMDLERWTDKRKLFMGMMGAVNDDINAIKASLARLDARCEQAHGLAQRALSELDMVRADVSEGHAKAGSRFIELQETVGKIDTGMTRYAADLKAAIAVVKDETTKVVMAQSQNRRAF